MILGAGVLVLAATLVAVVGRQPSTPTAAQIQDFQSAIQQPVQHWGKIEIYGMRPAMADLAQGTGQAPPSAIGQEARAWQDGFRQISQQLDAVSVPGALSHAMTLFKYALADYEQAASLVERAASEQSAARGALLSQAAQVAQNGDCAYDDASVELQHARQAAGLGTTTDFPDHPCSGGPRS